MHVKAHHHSLETTIIIRFRPHSNSSLLIACFEANFLERKFPFHEKPKTNPNKDSRAVS